MTPQDIYDYLHKYPTDLHARTALDTLDVSRFSESEKQKHGECVQFVSRHAEYAICLALYARNPFFIPNQKALRASSQRLNCKTEGGKLLLSRKNEQQATHITKDLLDFIVTTERKLLIGLKHYWLADEATFVYGAGRLIVSQDGAVEYIDNHSGHYKPTELQFYKTLELMSPVFTPKHIHVCTY